MAQPPDDLDWIPGNPIERAWMAEWRDILINSYWLCKGDAEAMTDLLLMQPFVLGVINYMRGRPPLVVNGETLSPDPDQAMCELISLRVLETTAWIEGHGQTRH